MVESWFALFALIVAVMAFAFVHWIAKHSSIKGASERRTILWLECVVMLCVVGGFYKDEILEILGRTSAHTSFRESVPYLFAALVASLIIYRAFTWKRGKHRPISRTSGPASLRDFR